MCLDINNNYAMPCRTVKEVGRNTKNFIATEGRTPLVGELVDNKGIK